MVSQSMSVKLMAGETAEMRKETKHWWRMGPKWGGSAWTGRALRDGDHCIECTDEQIVHLCRGLQRMWYNWLGAPACEPSAKAGQCARAASERWMRDEQRNRDGGNRGNGAGWIAPR